MRYREICIFAEEILVIKEFLSNFVVQNIIFVNTKRLFFIFLTFLILSCSEDNKEHTIERWSSWTQTIGETTYRFQFHSKMGWAGKEGKEYIAEHENGSCTYWTHPKGEESSGYLATSYQYERDRNSLILKENVPNYNPQTAPIWLQGYIENNIMFLRNDTLTLELEKIESFEDIQ
jgi:hypothetical protein